MWRRLERQDEYIEYQMESFAFESFYEAESTAEKWTEVIKQRGTQSKLFPNLEAVTFGSDHPYWIEVFGSLLLDPESAIKGVME
jgi:hypothetical protein